MSAIQLFDLNGQERFNGTSVGGGGSQPVLLTASLHLTSAQIKALNSTPLPIVAAPGASKALVIHTFSALYTFGGIAYATSTTINVAYAPSNNELTLDVLGGGANKFAMTSGAADAGAADGYVNTALNVLSIAGNPTAGNGTCVAVVTYTIDDYT